MSIRKALIVITWRPAPASQELQVLLLKVNQNRGGFWQSPTGKVEAGEDYPEGALREAEEETGFRFERSPQYLGLEYSFEGRWGPALERAFVLPIVGGNMPPLPTLDPKEHEEYQWVTPQEATRIVKHDANREAIARACTSPLFLSSRGLFFQEGEEITHERTVELLHRSIQKMNSGYQVVIGKESLELIVEDTPRFISGYDRHTGELRFTHGEKRILNPKQLLVRKDHAFILEDPDWPAKFLSSAYYEIMKDVREESQKYILYFLGRDYYLRIAH